jgi:ribosome assembly protein 1
VIDLIETKGELIKTIDKLSTQKHSEKLAIGSHLKDEIINLKNDLNKAFDSENSEGLWQNAVDNIWSFGPRRNGPNILLNRISNLNRPSYWRCISDDESKAVLPEYDWCIINGFQMATLSGPLCEEAMYGVCFMIEEWVTYNKPCPLLGRQTEVKDEDLKRVDSTGSFKEQKYDKQTKGKNIVLNSDSDEKSSQKSSGNYNHSNVHSNNDNGCLLSNTNQDVSDNKSADNIMNEVGHRDVYGPFSGQVMSAIKEGCRRAFQSQPQRLMWAMYSCTIQATADVLGKHTLQIIHDNNIRNRHTHDL